MGKKKKATIGVAEQQQGKDTDKSQYSKILSAFTSPKTMLMAARETGVERANVCRYVDSAIKQGTLFLIRYGLCAVSSHRAGYYSTDKRLLRMPLQMELFKEKGGNYGA